MILQKATELSTLSTARLRTIIIEILDVENRMKIINFVFRIMGMEMLAEKNLQTTTAISVTQQMLTKPGITNLISSVP